MAQVEIDEYRDYDKAAGALKEARRGQWGLHLRGRDVVWGSFGLGEL